MTGASSRSAKYTRLRSFVNFVLSRGQGHGMLEGEASSWAVQDEAMKAFYSRFIQPEDLVFDVGCNVGTRARVFLELGAKVVGFEPQPQCCSILERAFAGKGSFVIDPRAVGATSGHAELLRSGSSVLSTLSRDWIERVKESGRFGDVDWTSSMSVEVVTLAEAIQKYGKPSFVKIDTEGYEYEVIQGLDQPVRALSFEFAVESGERTEAVVRRLSELGMAEFQLGLGEEPRFHFGSWVDAEQLRSELRRVAEADRLAWGDVYSRTLE